MTNPTATMIDRIKKVRAATTLIDMATARRIIEAVDAAVTDHDGADAEWIREITIDAIVGFTHERYNALDGTRRLAARVFAAGLLDAADL